METAQAWGQATSAFTPRIPNSQAQSDAPDEAALLPDVPNDDLTLGPATSDPTGVGVPAKSSDGLLVAIETNNFSRLTLLRARCWCGCERPESKRTVMVAHGV